MTPFLSWPDLRYLAKQYGIWIGIFLLLIFLNSFVWNHVVRPEQARLREWQDVHRLRELKPKWESLLNDSNRLLRGEEARGFVKEDPSEAMQVIERLAGSHGVEIEKIAMKETAAEPSESSKKSSKSSKSRSDYTVATLALGAYGSFDRLARFMSELEAQSGLKIQHWSLTSARDYDGPHKLSADIKVFLRGEL